MKKISLFVLLFFMAIGANAGDNFKIGIYTGYNFDRHELSDYYITDKEALECCDFSGDKTDYQGISIIVSSEYKYCEFLSFDVRLGYFYSASEYMLLSNEYLSLRDDGDTLSSIPSKTSWNLDMDFHTVLINPNIRFFIFEALALNCGLQMSVNQKGHKKFTFNMLTPNRRFNKIDDPDIKYENSDRTIVFEDCDLDDELKMYMALNLGLSYDYNIYDDFYICPELHYFLPLTEILDGGYKISTFQAGLALKYALF